jgi:hypothetical protein
MRLLRVLIAFLVLVSLITCVVIKRSYAASSWQTDVIYAPLAR